MADPEVKWLKVWTAALDSRMSCTFDSSPCADPGLMKKPVHISAVSVDPHSAFNQPKPPCVDPQLLPAGTDDVSTLLVLQKAEIAKLAQKQDSLSRMVEQHTSKIDVLMEEHKNQICNIIELGFKDLPHKIFAAPPPDEAHPPSPGNLPESRTSSTSVGGSRSVTRKITTGIPRTGPTKPEETPEPEFSEFPRSTCRTRLKEFLNSQFFEIMMGSVIVINIGTIFVQLQWKGYESSFKLGLGSSDAGYRDAEKVFDLVEMGFNAIYLMELVLRLWHLRLRYFKSFMGTVDAVVVVVCCLQSFILEPAQLSLEESVVRIVRLFRLFRIIKIFRFMNTVEELRILLRTLSLSAGSLIWSMLLIGVIIIAAGVLMAQLTLSFIEDESADQEKREWVYLAYGSAARATYTMFEGAFTGVWTRNAEPLLENVSFGYGIFYVGYVVTINFAMIRVISALFLKQTMQVASNDADKRAIDKMQERQSLLEDTREFFEKTDSSGDGVLDEAEFEAMLKEPQVLELFKTLELTEPEARMLFDVLSGDEGVMDYREFLDGAMKMRHTSKAVDTVQVLHEVTVLGRRLDNLSEGMGSICSIIAPAKKWDPSAAPRKRVSSARYSPRPDEEKEAEVVYLSY